jgi:glycosyltransferase involved in cell wall biosynthesis
MNPLISIVIPVYNCEKYLRESLSSVFAQTFSDFELIIVDDGSTDNSVNIIREFDDDRIKIISMHQNGGVANALNIGIKIASAPLIARFDADDYMEVDRLELQYKYIRLNTEIDILGSSFKSYETEEIWIPPLNHDDIICNLLFCCPICHPSVIMKKNILIEANGYNEGSPAEDYFLWIDLFLRKKARFANMAEVLLKRRTFPDRPPGYYDRSYYCSKELRKKILLNLGVSDAENAIEIHERLRHTTPLSSHKDFLDRIEHLLNIIHLNNGRGLFDKYSLICMLGRYFYNTGEIKKNFCCDKIAQSDA